MEAYPGGGNSIFRSIRPGRSKAESRISIRLVAMMTCKLVEKRISYRVPKLQTTSII